MTGRTRALVLGLLAAAGAWGCDPEVHGGQWAGIDYETGSSSDAGPSGNADSDAGQGEDATGSQRPGPPETLAGKWGMFINGPTKQIGIPIVISQIIVSRNWLLVDLVADEDGGFTQYEKYCAITHRLETVLNKSRVPQYTTDSFKVVERRIEPIENTAPGTAWVSDLVWEARGVKLRNVADDPLPPNNAARDTPNQGVPCEEAEWGSHCDQDQDGHPGVTAVLSGALNCQLYGTHRWYSKLGGEIIDQNTISGLLTDTDSEQTVLAANTPVCTTGNPSNTSVMDQCPELHNFKMVRLPDDATCETVMAETSCIERPLQCAGDTAFRLNPPDDNPTHCR